MDQFQDGLADGTDRRTLITKAFLATSIGAAAAGLTVADDAEAQSGRRRGRRRRRGKTVEFDVACRGDTFRMTAADGANPAGGDFYGSFFLVEGYIYPKNTIPAGPGYTIDEDSATGHWFCSSSLMIGPRRGEPHLIGHQQYLFGRITANRLFPPNQLVSHGMEGSDSPTTFIRALTGGSGRYARARGTVRQTPIGTNNTEIAQLGGIAAPNFRFKINLV